MANDGRPPPPPSSRHHRKPLSECTNNNLRKNYSSSSKESKLKAPLFHASSTASPPKTRPRLSTSPPASHKRTRSQQSSSVGSTAGRGIIINSNKKVAVQEKQNSHDQQDSIQVSRSFSEIFRLESSEGGVTYKRHQRGSKRNNAEPSSCPPVVKSGHRWDMLDNKENEPGLSRGWSSVVHEKKRPRSKALPEDYVEKQRALFAEIDAFELPEESESEDEALEPFNSKKSNLPKV